MIKKKWLCLILFFSDIHTMEQKACWASCSKLFCCYTQKQPRPVAITALTKTKTTATDHHHNKSSRNNRLTTMMLKSPFDNLNPYEQYDIKNAMKLISGITDTTGRLAFSRRYLDGFPREWAERRYESYSTIILSMRTQYVDLVEERYGKQFPDMPKDIINIISLYVLKIDRAVNKTLMNYNQSIGSYDDNSFIPPRGYHTNQPYLDNSDSTDSNTLLFNIMKCPSDADDDDLFTSQATPHTDLFGNSRNTNRTINELRHFSRGQDDDLFSRSEESSSNDQ